MEPMAVVAYLSILALALLAASKLLRLLAPLLVALHGLLVAPIVKSLQQLGDRYFVKLGDDELEPAIDGRRSVPPDMYQAVPPSIGADDTSMVPPDALALARHLAALRQPNGLHWLSANKIALAVGGNRNEVMAAVRAVRGDEPPPASLGADPPADDPDAWEHGERPGQLVRRQRTAAR
jgi:hypothetical protein